MAIANSLVFAGIAPHPPIMVPEVGGESCVEVQSSISAMAELTQRVIESGAETVVLISPHAPLEAVAFVAYDGPRLYGDFSTFRAPETTVEAALDAELLSEITRAAEQHNLITLRILDTDLDHGTTVPLYFLQRNGWNGKVVALGYSFLSDEEHLRFGNCIRQAIATLRRPVAFIASGDLSHRLKPGAPAGFNPEAHRFDEAVVEAIRSGHPHRIATIGQDVRRRAGECGYRSMLVALGVVEDAKPSCEVLSYEGPFGVGYLVAQLMSGYAGVAPADPTGPSAQRTVESSPALQHWDQSPTDLSEPAQRATDYQHQPESAAEDLRTIPALARRTIETFITTGEVITPPANAGGSDLSFCAGCFVSIKTRAGDLRGCIGTIDPVKDSLAEEIIANALGAATRDPRFPPVRADELPNLKYSVDVLSAPEPCTIADLDPKTYGVIVEDESGRRGLLLPNLEGIKTATEQVEIASRKAGIAPGSPVKLSRFRADRYSE
ncbi:MAG TPA: AmmeMemoRadiSam system protein A [Pyrinomonadaceae bacterium]